MTPVHLSVLTRPSVAGSNAPNDSVAKLMALAIRFEQLVRDGVVADYAELARLGVADTTLAVRGDDADRMM